MRGSQRGSSHTRECAMCVLIKPRGRFWRSLPGPVSHEMPYVPVRDAACPCMSCWGFTCTQWSWRSWAKTRVLVLETSYTVLIVAWFNFKMCFHSTCDLILFIPFCAFRNLQTRPIAHKHMGKIGLSVPCSLASGNTSQTCISPLQPVFKSLWWWGLHNNTQLHAIII